MNDRLIIVSSDSHAGMPKELWSEYLDVRYHELIPKLHEDNAIYPVATAVTVLARREEDHRRAVRGAPRDPPYGMAWIARPGVADG